MIPPTSTHGVTVVFGIWKDLMAFLHSPKRETITTNISHVDRVGEDNKDIHFYLKRRSWKFEALTTFTVYVKTWLLF